jgi:hypothetical protein
VKKAVDFPSPISRNELFSLVDRSGARANRKSRASVSPPTRGFVPGIIAVRARKLQRIKGRKSR